MFFLPKPPIFAIFYIFPLSLFWSTPTPSEAGGIYVISNVVRNLKDEIPPPYGRRNDV